MDKRKLSSEIIQKISEKGVREGILEVRQTLLLDPPHKYI